MNKTINAAKAEEIKLKLYKEFTRIITEHTSKGQGISMLDAVSGLYGFFITAVADAEPSFQGGKLSEAFAKTLAKDVAEVKLQRAVNLSNTNKK